MWIKAWVAEKKDERGDNDALIMGTLPEGLFSI